MVKLIKADIYRYLRSPFMYSVCGALVVGITLVMLSAKGILNINIVELRGITRVEMINLICDFNAFTFFFYLMMIFGVVLVEEYGNRSLKNLISSSVSRTKIFFSKFIVQVILAYIVATICMIIFLLLLSLLEPGEGYNKELIIEFIKRFYISTIPYIGGISIVNFLGVIFKKQSIVCIIYYFILMQISNVIYIIERTVWSGIGKVQWIFLSTQVGDISTLFSGWGELPKVFTVSLCYIILFTAASVSIYKKQEA